MQVGFNVFLCHLIQASRPMEKACAFMINHWHTEVIASVDLPKHIPISLGTICLGTFEAYLSHFILHHDQIQVFPQKDLGCTILWLHVTTCNYQHLTTLVAHLTRQGGPILQTFHVVIYYPWIFYVPSNMDTFHKIYTSLEYLLTFWRWTFCLLIALGTY
jgi:hypothetical protein